MRFLMTIVVALISNTIIAQNTNPTNLGRDSLNIREQLVSAALQNSSLEIDDANVNIAEYNLKKAKGAWQDVVNFNGNINEFVVNNSPAANFYPKYNLGINVPLSIFNKQSNNVKIARETLRINAVQKNEREKLIRAEVLRTYETYLEKKDNLQLQSEVTQEIYSAYLKAQADYAASTISLEKLNLAYKEYNDELQEQRTAEKELNIAYIDLEYYVGFRLKEILTQFGIK